MWRMVIYNFIKFFAPVVQVFESPYSHLWKMGGGVGS